MVHRWPKSNFLIPLFDTLCQAGEKFGLKHIGMQAINSLRVEVGYRHWETDIKPPGMGCNCGIGDMLGDQPCGVKAMELAGAPNLCGYDQSVIELILDGLPWPSSEGGH